MSDSGKNWAEHRYSTVGPFEQDRAALRRHAEERQKQYGLVTLAPSTVLALLDEFQAGRQRGAQDMADLTADRMLTAKEAGFLCQFITHGIGFHDPEMTVIHKKLSRIANAAHIEKERLGL